MLYFQILFKKYLIMFDSINVISLKTNMHWNFKITSVVELIKSGRMDCSGQSAE